MNHIIIGLGGTGGKILASLRRRMVSYCGEPDPANHFVGYLYIDSSTDELNMDTEDWVSQGIPVKLPPNSILNLKDGIDLNQYINNQANHFNLKHWLGKPNRFKNILPALSKQGAAAGQIRRIGRLLFAVNSTAYRTAVIEKYNQLKNISKVADVTVHICCGLAGGTGSGGIVDAVLQANEAFIAAGVSNLKILLYLQLPEQAPGAKAKDNFYANGYAALLELNALSVGRFSPHDVSLKADKKLKVGGVNSFFGCYLFSNVNENSNILGVDNGELFGMVSDFLFQKIILPGVTANIAIGLGMAEDSQNHLNLPEINTSGQPERGKFFLSFGIKRLEIPIVEMEEYTAYYFMKQAVHKFLFNHWANGQGYQGTANQAADKDAFWLEYVQDAATRERFGLTEEHLTRSKSFDANRLVDISKDWKSQRAAFKKEALTQRREALSFLEKKYEDYYDKHFRNVGGTNAVLGVEQYYVQQFGFLDQFANIIAERIQAALFSDWETNGKSIHTVLGIIKQLVEFLKTEAQNLDKASVASKTHAERLKTTLAANKAYWTKIGTFTDLVFGDSAKCLETHSEELHNRYVSKTYEKAYEFAAALLRTLDLKLQTLITQISKVNTTMYLAVENLTKKINSRCENGGTFDAVVGISGKYYNPKDLKDCVHVLCSNKTHQETNHKNIVSEIIKTLGSTPSFAVLSKIGEGKFAEILEQKTFDFVKNQLITDELTLQEILNGDIMQKMEFEFNGNIAGLTKNVNQWMDSAGTYLEFDKQESTLHGGKWAPVVYVVVLPNNPAPGGFHASLKTCFNNAIPSGKSGTPVAFASSPRKNEITLISVRHGFPLRYVKQVKILKDRYEERIEGDEDPQIQLHIEDAEFPPLFIYEQTPEEIYKEALPYLILAKLGDIVNELPDGSFEIFDRNERKVKMPNTVIALGKNWEDAPQQIVGQEQLDLLKSNVTNRMKLSALPKAEKEILLDKVAEMVNQAENGPADVYQKYLDANEAIEKILA